MYTFCTPYEYICVPLYTNRQYILNIKWAWLTKKQTITITIDNAAQYNNKGEWLYVSLQTWIYALIIGRGCTFAYRK